MSQNLLSAAVVIGALRVKPVFWVLKKIILLSTHNNFVCLCVESEKIISIMHSFGDLFNTLSLVKAA